MTFAEPGMTTGAAQTARENFRGSAIPTLPTMLLDPFLHPKPYVDLFTASERSARLTGNIASESAATEEAYDQRIAAVKAATGVVLENPERGGYMAEARAAAREQLRAGIRGDPDVPVGQGIAAIQRDTFNRKLAALQQDHPELQFGDLDQDARKIAGQAAAPAAPVPQGERADPALGLATSFLGGLVGSRRDPIFLGSLLAGPAAGMGRTALARIASLAMRSGLYNAGISAMEQPAVQEWRAKIGIEHGVIPALEDVGYAFALGLIPGAVVQGVKEGFRAGLHSPALKRVLAGQPEPGDVAAIAEHLDVAAPREAAALQAGEESVAADRATITIPKPKNVPAEIHDDMMAAALKRADQPDAPSPEAVATVHAIEAYHGSPHDFEAFSTEHIGTGEGAQAYGHGLYFAENAEVAQSYTNAGGSASAIGIAKAYLKNFSDRDRAIKSLENKGHFGPQYEEAANLLRDPNWSPSNTLYRVRINADPEHFLDWDKPLSEQSEYVQQAFAKAFPTAVEAAKHPGAPPLLGKEFVQNTQGTQALREAGIPGIKYLDQGSRDAGVGTRNFVVFSDKDVEITHRNGKPVQPPVPQEVADRITEAAPKSAAEAATVADEALDDMGRQHGMAALRDRMAAGDAERAPTPTPVEEPVQASRPRGDIMDKMPWVDEAGNPKTISAKGAAAIGEKETTLAMLVRSCK